MEVAANLPLLASPGLQPIASIVHGFTTRAGGLSQGPFASLNLATRVDDDRSAVLQNRAAVLVALGRADANLIAVRQVHGDALVEVTRNAGPNIEGDALWTRDPQAVLAILVADCLPILLADRAGTVVAAVHAGWRGTEKRLVAAMVARLRSAGVSPADLVVSLGPCIGPCCFEIGEDVAFPLRNAFPDPGEAVLPRGDRFVANLWDLNRRALVEAGVPAANIDSVARCTHCDAAFFSYRRDAKRTGRQAGVIGFAPKN